MKGRLRKSIARTLAVIALGCVPFIVAPANRTTTAALSAVSPSVSPTPVPTPEVKRPNPVRRFFSSIFDGIAGVFRRRPKSSGCYLPLSVNQITSSRDVVKLCPPGTNSAPDCSSDSDVMLTADAMHAEDTELLFTWSVTAGRIRGEGRKVTWNLSGLPEGTYIATVTVSDANIHAATGAIKVEVATCSDCVFLSSPCPTVWVSCPSRVESKQRVEFVANLAGGDPTLTPTYEWLLSAGKIISGQKTSKIAVAVSDLPGRSLTAKVKIGGFPEGCSDITVASCMTEVGQ